MRVIAAKVYLVRAGPGDPELLTRRAVIRLRAADLISMHDISLDIGPTRHGITRAWRSYQASNASGSACRNRPASRIVYPLFQFALVPARPPHRHG